MSDLYAKVTGQIIKAIEGGHVPWRRPWKDSLSSMIMPCNAETNKLYRGINVPILWMEGHLKGFATPLWGTQETWKRLGGTILKRQYPTEIVFYRFFKKAVKGKERTIPLMRTFEVYNLDQVYGCFTLAQKWKPKPITSEDQLSFEPAEKVIKACKAKITYGGNQAAYSPTLDRIRMPAKGQFHTRVGYWTTLLHEHAHWSGHEKRLNRTFGAPRTNEYYYEELIAEMSACFLSATLGLPEALEQMPQHASYLSSYLKLLRQDNKIIFKASTAATKVTEFIMNGGRVDAAAIT